MRSGTKNVFVIIERQAETKDAATNAPIFTWSTYKTAWASTQSRRGREVAMGDQIKAQSYVRFDFDYLDVVGVTELDRLNVDGALYMITGLLPDLSTKDVFQIDAVLQAPVSGRA